MPVLIRLVTPTLHTYAYALVFIKDTTLLGLAKGLHLISHNERDLRSDLNLVTTDHHYSWVAILMVSGHKILVTPEVPLIVAELWVSEKNCIQIQIQHRITKYN